MNYRFSDKLASMKPSAIREIFKSLTDPTVIAFAAGNPAPESFPVEELAQLSESIFRTCPAEALQYGITEGYAPLREAVAARQRKRFGNGALPDTQDTTLILSGGQQGIELACKALCNEGDTVLCETPTFIGALNAFRSNGAVPRGIPLKEDGIDTDGLEKALRTDKRVKLLYLIPTFQNPTGITTSAEKRKIIYELASKYRVPILEDDPYGELRFAGKDVSTLKSMDREGLVIYCSTFSKILSAGMRVGFALAPREIASKMIIAKQVEDVHTNLFFQMLCHRYMTECDLDGHIESIRSLYRRKCGLMLEALEQELPNEVTFTRPEGGLFLWCTLPRRVDLDKFVQNALSKKVAVVPGGTFLCDGDAPSHSFRLNYSTPTDAQITEGVKRLGEVAREFLK